MTTQPLLEVTNLTVDLLTAQTAVRPVDGVSYRLNRRETLAIVGESGSGKTVMNFAPLGLAPIGVVADVSGSIRFDGTELVGSNEETLRALRGKSVGFIFQDPMSALNPARTIGIETGPVEKVLVSPRHPYTMGLIDAIPSRSDPVGAPFRGLPGMPPVLSAPIPGCAFEARCPHAVPACRTNRPKLERTADAAIFAACPVLNTSCKERIG